MIVSISKARWQEKYNTEMCWYPCDKAMMLDIQSQLSSTLFSFEIYQIPLIDVKNEVQIEK